MSLPPAGQWTFGLSAPSNSSIKLRVDSSGVLGLNSFVDYDTVPRPNPLNAQLTATLVGNASAVVRCSLTVRVTDVNDNSPTFSRSSYQLSLPEDAALGSLVFRGQAVDVDEGKFAAIRYKLATSTDTSFVPAGIDNATLGVGTFTVNATSGEVTLIASLDFERRTQYSVYLLAEDGGGRTGSAILQVTVEDRNDIPPTLRVYAFPTAHGFPAQTHFVSEGVNASQHITFVFLGDNETDARLSIHMLGGKADFSLEFFIPFRPPGDVQGKLYVINALPLLDREMISRYDLVIVAEDKYQGVVLETRLNYTVWVVDKNDNKPRFLSLSYERRVAENTPIGVSLVQVSAVDPDLNDSVTYEIASVNGKLSQAFVINSSGVISAVAQFDYEQTKVFELRVEAVSSRNKTHRATASVRIIVTDINDNAPQFAKAAYTFHVSEKILPQSEVGRVAATDKDSGTNAEITYFLSPSAQVAAQVFEVNRATGQILTRSQVVLDHERTSSYNFTVFARDGGSPALTSSVEVTVIVADDNDNPPRFISPPVRVSVWQGAKPGHLIVTFRVLDPDTAENSKTSTRCKRRHQVVDFYCSDYESTAKASCLCRTL